MLKNPRHELFARLVAAGKPATRAYVEAGFAESGADQSACRLLKKPGVEKRVRELQAEIGAKLDKRTIRDLNERLNEYQTRWDKMRTVTQERAEAPEMQDVPGGRTGLLVRTIKSIGSGEKATTVEEFAVDTGLLREIRELELQVSKELGQFVEKHDVTGTILNGTDPYRLVGETITGVPCSSGCTIIMPIIRGRVVYYRWKYFNSGGTLIYTEPLRTPLAVN
jgi:hypothetical protein